MAGKPFFIRAFSWAGARVGPERLASLLSTAYRLQFTLGPDRGPLLSAYARVLGRAPSPAQARAHLAALAENYAGSLTSLYTLDQLTAAQRAAAVETPALEAIEALRRRGRGVILATPHFGDVPRAIVALAARGLPLRVMFVNGAAYKWCEAFGFKVSSLGEGAAEYWGALRANEAVLIYSDLDFFPEGRTAPFFSAPVRPPHGLARLALAAESPVLPVYAVSEGGRCRLVADAPLEPDAAAGPEALERRLLASMERFIAERPDHWLMLRDLWDIETSDALNRRQLAAIAAYRRWLG